MHLNASASTLIQSPRDLARVDPFAGAVFGDDARLAEIHFARDFFHERLRTGHDGRDLKRTLQESLKEERAHRKGEIVNRRLRLVQSRCEEEGAACIAVIPRLAQRAEGSPICSSGFRQTPSAQ